MTELLLSTSHDFYEKLEARALELGINMGLLIDLTICNRLPNFDDAPPTEFSARRNPGNSATIFEEIDEGTWDLLYAYAKAHQLDFDDVAIALIERFALDYRI